MFLAPGRLRSWASAIPIALSNFTNNGPLIQGPFCGADRRVRRGGWGVGPDDDDLSAMTCCRVGICSKVQQVPAKLVLPAVDGFDIDKILGPGQVGGRTHLTCI